jgi:hypothetical protein
MRSRMFLLLVLAAFAFALVACSWHASGSGLVTYRECIGEYCSEGEIEVPDSRLSFGGVGLCKDVEADETFDWPHAHFSGQFQMNAPDQHIRAHLVMDTEADAYAGEEYGVWTCDEYAQMIDMVHQFSFVGEFTEQPQGTSGTAQVILVPWEDYFQVQVILNPGDYHSWMWSGHIEQGKLSLIPG